MKKRKIKYTRIVILGLFLLCLGVYSTRNSFIKEYTPKYDTENKVEPVGGTIDDIEEETAIRLYKMAKTDERVSKILENKNQYPSILLEMLSRNKDMIEYVTHYLEKKGKVYTNTIGKVQKGKFPLLLQYDEKWGYGLYGDTVLAINGCGPTVLSMVVAGLTGRTDVTPYTIAKFSEQNGYFEKESGTSWSLMTEGIKRYGVIGTNISLTRSAIVNALEEGKPIACSMRKGDFTTTGHFILIVGMKNNQFIIRDPNSKERSEKLWEYDTLSRQIKNLWAFENV